MYNRFTKIAVFTLLVLFAFTASAEMISVPGEFLVKFRESPTEHRRVSGGTFAQEVFSLRNIDIKKEFENLNISHIKINQNENVQDIIAELTNHPDVEYIEPNYVRMIQTIPTNDTFNNLLWALHNSGQEIIGSYGTVTGTVDADIDIPEAWTLSMGNTGQVTVAVIDNGVFYTHPDLTDNMWDGTNCLNDQGAALGGCIHGYDFANNDTNPLPSAGQSHGTHVSGTIVGVGNNDQGIVGVAPFAKIMALRFALDVASEIKAIDFAIHNGAKIINASFGGPGYSQAEFDAIERFKNAGGLFIAAAGNSASSNDFSAVYPASYNLENIITVAATDQHDDLASFSNFGATSVHVGAPGTNILSTLVNNQYGFADGTSMAAPHVAGLAALVWAYEPSLSRDQVRTIILNNGESRESLHEIITTGKRINALRSMADVFLYKAQQIHDASIQGLESGMYPEESKQLLQTAINDAVVIKNSSLSSDQDVLTMVASVEQSLVDFLASVIPEEEIPDPEPQDPEPEDPVGEEENNDPEPQEDEPLVVTSPPPRSGGGGGGGGGGNISSPALIVNEQSTEPIQNQLPPTSSEVPQTYSDQLVVCPVTFTTTLRIGSQGSDVVALQTFLKCVGLYAGALDGSFGPMTQNAVIMYQRSRAITADGIVGPMSRQMMMQTDTINRYLYTQTPQPVLATVSQKPLLRRGSQGISVTQLQQLLVVSGWYTGPITGTFGPMTENAVRLFQQSQSLTPDGVVGNQTWSRL